MSAYPNPLAAIGVDRFYADYWQRQPLLLRNALPDHPLPVDADELAGLACEDWVASRLITGSWEENNFTLQHGPIDGSVYETLGERDWTLLVQDVDKLHPNAAELLTRFDFIPAWRLDDLMISFAASGGSVGPHTDEYDVFLLQLSGRRRWQISQNFDPGWREGMDLRVLDAFSGEQEWICEPGDLLYLPPGVAHYGVALEPGMTASVGLRAPSLADLVDDLADHWAQRETSPRYSDADCGPPADRWQVDAAAIARFRALLMQLANAPEAEFHAWLGSALGRYRLAMPLLNEEHSELPPVRQQQLIAALRRGDCLWQRQPAARLHWLACGDAALLCANGETLQCSVAEARQVCASPILRAPLEISDQVLDFCLTSAAFELSDEDVAGT
ncbi:MAG: cupin domain-containing protein [Wenzhouxiangellaceae bacterium]